MNLALAEIRRNRSRFLLITLVIALLTTLLLFISALAEGLGSGNIEGLAKLDADLLVFQEKSKLSLAASALPWERLAQVRRVPGVAQVGAVGFSAVTVPAEATLDRRALDVAFLGVQPGLPGEPPVLAGRQLKTERELAAIIDRKTQLRTGLRPGGKLIVRSVQDAREELYELTVAGITDGRQYSLRPSIFVPIKTWDRVRPGPKVDADSRALIVSFLAVRAAPGLPQPELADRLTRAVGKIEVANLRTAYEATPGYKEQQSTLSTQQGFTWFIGVLVIGVFFQIITLQKVGQVGVLKAMGASNGLIASSALAQMLVVTAGGVLVGGAGAYLLALGIPPTVPLSWPLNTLALTIISLLVMGPLGGLISLRVLLRVEPLTALGLAK